MPNPKPKTIRKGKGFYGIPDKWLNTCIEEGKKGGGEIEPEYECKKYWNQHLTSKERQRIIIENRSYETKKC